MKGRKWAMKTRGDVSRPGCEVLLENLADTENFGRGIGKRGADMVSYVKSAFANSSHGTSLSGMDYFANG